MLHSNVGLESVFQVWYSSAWSSNVLPSFRKCCTLALERWEASESSEASRNEVKVTAYLRHWASAEPIGVRELRHKFFTHLERYNSNAFSNTSSTLRTNDRVAILQYLLTGERVNCCTTTLLCQRIVRPRGLPHQLVQRLNPAPPIKKARQKTIQDRRQ